MNSDLVVIFHTPSEIEANVVRGLLETHEIPSVLLSDNSRTAFPLALNDQAWERRVAVAPEHAAAVPGAAVGRLVPGPAGSIAVRR